MELDDFYDRVYDWLLLNGPKFILGVFLFIIGQLVIKFLGKWIKNSFHKKDVHSSIRPFIESLVITSLQIILVLAVLQVIGVRMTIFAAGIASLGVAIGLALSGTLQNFAGGLLILLLKPFKVGDNILAQGQDGIVSSIQLFHTILTTFDNRTVIIPNGKLSNEVIINISREGNRRLDIEMKFNYGFVPEELQTIVQKVIDNASDIVKEHEPTIGISSLDADGFKLIIQVWVNALAYNAIKITFQQKVLKAIKDAGFKLPGMS
jgi:small conductance mechanosensitive channel